MPFWRGIAIFVGAHFLAFVSVYLNGMDIAFLNISESLIVYRLSLLIASILLLLLIFKSSAAIVVGGCLPRVGATILVTAFTTLFFFADFLLSVYTLSYRPLNPEVTPAFAGRVEFFFSIWRGPNIGFWGVISFLVLAPISEELLFRGVLQRSLVSTKLGVIGAVFISSSLWTLDHPGLINLYSVVSVFVTGCLLGFVMHRYKSLALCIVIHVLLNSFWYLSWNAAHSWL